VADLVRHLQAALFLAADSLHVWRDGAIALLALAVIGLLSLAAGDR
jgi:hypothetical protein